MERFHKLSVIAAVVFAILAGYHAHTDQDKLLQAASDPYKIRHFQKANRPLLKSLVNEKRIVFLGDSLTSRWKIPLEIGGYHTINRGIGGNTTDSMVARFNNDVIKLHPIRVVVLGGINDLIITYRGDPDSLDMQVEKVAGNLRIITKRSKKAGISPILCSLLPVGRQYHLPAGVINPAVQGLNLIIRKIALEEKVTYVDLYSILVDPRTGMLADNYANDDGIHLTQKAYERILEAITPELSRKDSQATSLGKKSPGNEPGEIMRNPVRQ